MCAQHTRAEKPGTILGLDNLKFQIQINFLLSAQQFYIFLRILGHRSGNENYSQTVLNFNAFFKNTSLVSLCVNNILLTTKFVHNFQYNLRAYEFTHMSD